MYPSSSYNTDVTLPSWKLTMIPTLARRFSRNKIKIHQQRCINKMILILHRTCHIILFDNIQITEIKLSIVNNRSTGKVSYRYITSIHLTSTCSIHRTWNSFTKTKPTKHEWRISNPVLFIETIRWIVLHNFNNEFCKRRLVIEIGTQILNF